MYSCDKYLLSAYDEYGVQWGAIFDLSFEKLTSHFPVKPYPAVIEKDNLFENTYVFFHYFTICFIDLSQQSFQENSHRKYFRWRFLFS